MGVEKYTTHHQDTAGQGYDADATIKLMTRLRRKSTALVYHIVITHFIVYRTYITGVHQIRFKCLGPSPHRTAGPVPLSPCP